MPLVKIFAKIIQTPKKYLLPIIIAILWLVIPLLMKLKGGNVIVNEEE